jgi:hypothetical protein
MEELWKNQTEEHGLRNPKGRSSSVEKTSAEEENWG